MASWILVDINSSNIGLLLYDENGVWYHTGTDLISDNLNCDQCNNMPKNWVIQNFVFEKLKKKMSRKSLKKLLSKLEAYTKGFYLVINPELCLTCISHFPPLTAWISNFSKA